LELDLQRLVVERGLSIGRVVHVGAHIGQEAELYAQLGASSVTWVEGNPEVVPRLQAHVEPLGQRVLEALLSDQPGAMTTFNVTNNEWSSSMLELGTHRIERPDVVVTHSLEIPTVTLDELCAHDDLGVIDTLVIDVQGAELLVLRGGRESLNMVEQLVVEVNEAQLYEGGALLPEIDAFLSDFDRVETVINTHRYGDALYLRRRSASRGVPRIHRRLPPAARRRAKEIPVFVLCRDRVTPLAQLVAWLERAGLQRIILVDNASTYPPLLDYYRESRHHVVFLGENVGHAAVWDVDLLDRFRVVGPFVVTDPDVIPCKECPLDAIAHFLDILQRYPEAEKVGFGLQIADIPDHYALKPLVARWESQFWRAAVEPGVYRAPIDTTFAVYAPGTRHSSDTGLRTGWPYLARHEPWYADSSNLSVEERYYRDRARSDVTTWNRDQVRPELAVALAQQRHRGSTAPFASSAYRPGEAPELDLSDPAVRARLHKPRFTILMPTRGPSDRIEGAVQAILSQDYEDWELIIKSASSGLRSSLPGDARIKILEGPDRNLTHAVNQAIGHATGDVYYWANDDDRLLPGTLRYVAEHLGDAMWLRGLVEIVDDTGRQLRIDGASPWDLTTLKGSNFVCEPGAFWRRQCTEAVGILDESVPLASDYEYWLRLGERWEPVTVDTVLARYTEHADSASVVQADLQAHQAARIAARYGFSQLAAARVETTRLQRRNQELEAHLHALEQSEWWRLTAPLRHLVGALRRVGRPREGKT